MTKSIDFWESYYSQNKYPKNPSLFAEFVKPFLIKNEKLLELGCGNGRDSVFFAKNGVDVIGVDQCSNEIKFLSDEFSSFENLNFFVSDMTDLSLEINPFYVYSRFTIHSIDEQGEDRLLKWVGDNIKVGGLFFIEVRSVKDELFGVGEKVAKNTYQTDHFRRFIEIETLVSKLESEYFRILYKLEAQGLAPYKEEDPTVIRLVAIRV